MKRINTYIVEKLKINKNKLNCGSGYELFPENIGELERMIKDEINRNGVNCSLNHINVSNLDNLSYLFSTPVLKKFNGDISEWDVSNVKSMNHMFYESKFNGDISQWDVSNVEDMEDMFIKSAFNGDINDWDISNVKNMANMFNGSVFNQDISKWDMSNVKNIKGMFYNSKFNQDISNWNINKRLPIDNMIYVFHNCDIKNEYKPDIFRD